jgi:hypothetical protein
VTGIAPTLWSAIVVREWVQLAPEDAVKVVERSIDQGTGDWNRALTRALIQGWFREGLPPGDLMGMFEKFVPGRPQKEGLDMLLERTVDSQGWEAATAIVEAVPRDYQGDLFRRVAFQRMATVLCARDPELAVRWATPHAGTSYGSLLFRRIARSWARRDAAKAIAWIRSLDIPVEEKDSISGEVFRIWQNTKPEAAASWIESVGYGPDLALAFRRRALLAIRSGDSETAFAVIDSIPDTAAREEVTIIVGQAWLAKDPEAAGSWLEASELPSRVVAEIRRRDVRGKPRSG